MNVDGIGWLSGADGWLTRNWIIRAIRFGLIDWVQVVERRDDGTAGVQVDLIALLNRKSALSWDSLCYSFTINSNNYSTANRGT